MTKPAAATPPARLEIENPSPLSPACVNGAIAPDTNQIHQFLQLLGKDPATARLRFFPHKHNPKKKQIGARPEVGVDPRAIARHQRLPHGRGAYIAIGNSDGKGDSKENILTVPALFVEWDDKPIEWQKTAWQELGLPEPSIQVATGGKSIHTYWLLTSPLPRSEWEPLQKRLVELCGSDDQVKDCTRVMRLPGCAYIGPEGTPTGQTTIISATGKRYDAAQILPPEAEKPPAPPPRQTDRGPLPPRDESAILDALAKVPEFHHDEGRREELLGLALRLWVEVGKDRAHELLAAHSPAITDLDGYFTTEPTQISPGSFWPFVRDRYGVDIKRHDLKPSKAKPRGAKEPNQKAPAPTAPFRVLGWNETRDKVWVQTGHLGQVAAIPHTKAGLQRIAPYGYWETLHPSKYGVDWDAAVSAIYEQAESAGIFQLENLRGRGVWLDRGRIVWNLGDRLEVEGALIRHADFQDRVFTYASLPPLAIDPKVPPLTDGEGQAILDLFTQAMRWHGPDDGLLVLGHAVLANVGGALDIRPGLQITGGSGEGKSTVISGMMRPLHAGLGFFDSGSTEAGIRQAAGCDALPIVLDESEQETPDKREGHLRLLRLSYDGQPLRKGTQGGKANVYTMRSAIALAGINSMVPNQADRNRLVFARPRKLPHEKWAEFKAQRDSLLTITTGQSLLRRSITNLHILLANIRTMASVIGQMLDTSRSAETYAPLLAAAHSITSTLQLDQAGALAWLDSVGWQGPDEEAREALAADSEARACLDHLLGHPVPWKDSNTGNTNVRALVQIVREGIGRDQEAAMALGHLAIKVDPELGLVVGNACKCFTGSRWANKAHHERLLELPGAERTSTAVWFVGGGSHRAVAVPIKLAQTELFSGSKVSRLTPNGAPNGGRQAKAS